MVCFLQWVASLVVGVAVPVLFIVALVGVFLLLVAAYERVLHFTTVRFSAPRFPKFVHRYGPGALITSCLVFLVVVVTVVANETLFGCDSCRPSWLPPPASCPSEWPSPEEVLYIRDDMNTFSWLGACPETPADLPEGLSLVNCTTGEVARLSESEWRRLRSRVGS